MRGRNGSGQGRWGGLFARAERAAASPVRRGRSEPGVRQREGLYQPFVQPRSCSRLNVGSACRHGRRRREHSPCQPGNQPVGQGKSLVSGTYTLKHVIRCFIKCVSRCPRGENAPSNQLKSLPGCAEAIKANGEFRKIIRPLNACLLPGANPLDTAGGIKANIWRLLDIFTVSIGGFSVLDNHFSAITPSQPPAHPPHD
jgi:hypothetical protein